MFSGGSLERLTNTILVAVVFLVLSLIYQLFNMLGFVWDLKADIIFITIIIVVAIDGYILVWYLVFINIEFRIIFSLMFGKDCLLIMFEWLGFPMNIKRLLINCYGCC